MNEEFESINDHFPNLGTALAQRVVQKQSINTSAPGTFDPYQAMLKKKESETAPVDPSAIQQWPKKDVKALEDYCLKMGIVGFSCGKLPPIVALAILKRQLGEDFTDVSLEQRIPTGYGPNYPYSQVIQKRQILHG